VIGVGAAPDTSRLIEQIAFPRIGAPPGLDAWGIWKVVGGVEQLSFERDLVTNVITIMNFGDFPFFLCHTNKPPGYA
jgi:hypothetical protein